MKQPPTIQPASRPGPAYDPMDRIIESLQNIESFLVKLEDNPRDLHYFNTHLSKILTLRKTISQQLDLLFDEPYNYPHARLSILHKENEKIFSNLEGIVGSINPWDHVAFKKFTEAAMQSIEIFDNELTP